jgi:AP-3 complex subunit beta
MFADSSQTDFVVSNTVLVLKSLHQIQLASPTAEKSSLSIIARLARRLDSIRHPQARACVVWLVGQYAKVSEAGNGSAFASIGPASGLEGITEWAPDVLRKTAKTFADEADSVKLQIVNLSAKLLVLCPSNTTLQLLSRYGFSLARYDANYDIRDRGRMLSALLSGLHVGLMVTEQEEEDAGLEQGGVILRREQVELVLFGGKAPSEEEESWLRELHIISVTREIN